MKVLVTGTDGYIGVVLARVLIDRGHEVVGLDAGFYRDGWLLETVPTSTTLINKDTRCVTENDLQGFDAVVHLAELSNDPLGEHNPELTLDINYRSSVRLASLCKASGITRFVYSSSCSVYGAGSDDLRTEESEAFPQTVYARCKILVERALVAMADERFSPTILRNATAFGPSPRMRFDIVLNNLAGFAWTTGDIKMISDGTPWRPLVHVLDVCEAVSCALEAPRDCIHAQVFNVGSESQNYRVRDIAEIVSHAFPGCRLTFGGSSGDNRSYRVCFEKIHTQLPGFSCTRDAVLGAHELHALFERLGLTQQMFEFRAFTRLQQLQHLINTGQVTADLFWKQ